MNEISLLELLGQVSSKYTGQVFRDFLQGHVRELISEVMAAGQLPKSPSFAALSIVPRPVITFARSLLLGMCSWTVNAKKSPPFNMQLTGPF